MRHGRGTPWKKEKEAQTQGSAVYAPLLNLPAAEEGEAESFAGGYCSSSAHAGHLARALLHTYLGGQRPPAVCLRHSD